MTSIWALQFHSLSAQPLLWISKPLVTFDSHEIRREFVIPHGQMKLNRSVTNPLFQLRAIKGSTGQHQSDSTRDKLQSMISILPPVVFMRRRPEEGGRSNLIMWLSVATAVLIITVRVYVVKKTRYKRPPGSVADLVRRGQLRSDRRGISRPLNYDDPFNNPLVKVSKSNSTVEMCGKVYRLAPVTLTKEQQAIHQKRRSRAYQWKRPTIFLKEGDSIPPHVDPDTVRWIPANHPFATTATDLDEDLAQTNVYQKHGVPFRIRAEHEALQRKLEALQQDQKLDKLVLDSSNAKDFERPLKSNRKSNELLEQSPVNNQSGEPKPSKSSSTPNSFDSSSSPEEMQKQ